MAQSIDLRTDQRLRRWLDTRLPIPRLAYDPVHHLPDAAQSELSGGPSAASSPSASACRSSPASCSPCITCRTPELAFDSVENIMRDVNYGWLMRYSHAVGASMFFLAVYIHMFRGLYYGSYKAPREVLWILGVLIYLLMMATAFMGYSLPWGQMSLLGGHRHHQSVLLARRDHPRPRHDGIVHLALGRLRGRRRHAQPVLLPALSACRS